MKNIRKSIYKIISPTSGGTIGKIYDVFMLAVIICSIIPLAFKSQNILSLKMIDYNTTTVFVVDYILRFITADYHFKDKRLPFLRYPFSPLAIIDLLSILPSFFMINNSLRLFKIVRLLKMMKIFKAIRYSKSVIMISNAVKRQKDALITVCVVAVFYVLVSALIIINVEPESFDNYFEAVYWATVSLTTVGYGDIYPVTAAGRIITMISSIFGIAIVALPASILTAGFLSEINSE